MRSKSFSYCRFWRGMYNRFENGVHPREPLGDLLAATTEHTQALSDQADFLTKVISCIEAFTHVVYCIIKCI